MGQRRGPRRTQTPSPDSGLTSAALALVSRQASERRESSEPISAPHHGEGQLTGFDRFPEARARRSARRSARASVVRPARPLNGTLLRPLGRAPRISVSTATVRVHRRFSPGRGATQRAPLRRPSARRVIAIVVCALLRQGEHEARAAGCACMTHRACDRDDGGASICHREACVRQPRAGDPRRGLVGLRPPPRSRRRAGCRCRRRRSPTAQPEPRPRRNTCMKSGP